MIFIPIKFCLYLIFCRKTAIYSRSKTNELTTIQEITQKVKVSEKTIKRELPTLQEKGTLTREGGRKDGRWVILKPQE